MATSIWWRSKKWSNGIKRLCFVLYDILFII